MRRDEKHSIRRNRAGVGCSYKRSPTMTRARFVAVATVVFAVCFFPSLARAQAPRTWVSGVGDDFNPCSRTAPCKTFAGAISNTAAAGEIDTLDPGAFG